VASLLQTITHDAPKTELPLGAFHGTCQGNNITWRAQPSKLPAKILGRAKFPSLHHRKEGQDA
jgi:hypothetical protein